MEILGLSLAALGILFTYIWRANGKLQKWMMQAFVRIEEGSVRIEEGLVRIEEGQKEIVKIIEKGFSTLAQMILNQTKILEKIEARISPSS
ncbi:MAG: hypothetical protein AB1567_11800 [bacterium]